MVERDPVTEPAGDMVAAHTLVELLTWLEEGGAEKYQELCSVLLGWKGKRLRDAIADVGVEHLGTRQTEVNENSNPDAMERLAMGAGLALSSAAIAKFIAQWLALEPENQEFRRLRLRAMGGLVQVLSRRREQDLAPHAIDLLEARAELPAGEPAMNDLRRVDLDGGLADHLYRQFGRGGDDSADRIRKWLCENAHYVNEDKHRVLRTASVLGHWDVVEALFASGYPFGPATSNQGDDARSSLPAYVAERLGTEAPELLLHITQRVVDLEGEHDKEAMDGWCAAIRDRQGEPAFKTAAALLPGAGASP
jgi:hypothetical protein